MPDVNHFWWSDVVMSPSGDFATVDGLERSTQRIIRRLMTAAQELLLHQNYGANVRAQIGRVMDVDAIRALMVSQIYQEASVAKSPAPVITITPFFGGVTVSIVYYCAFTGKQLTLSFDLNG